MKKTLLIVVALVCSIVLCALFIRNYAQKNQDKRILGEHISARAEEYMKKRRAEGNLNWNLNTTPVPESSEPTSRIVRIAECVQFTSPFVVRGIQNTGNCGAEIRTAEPTGLFTVYTQPVSGNWKETNHIVMRRNNPESYREQLVQSNGREFLLFTVHDPFTYQVTAFTEYSGLLFTITYTVSSSQTYEKEFVSVLESLLWVQ